MPHIDDSALFLSEFATTHIPASRSILLNMRWVKCDSQLEKQDLHTTSTDAGISIVATPLSANADCSIRCNIEFDSNVTDVSDMQW
jgi:hypothetical protein